MAGRAESSTDLTSSVPAPVFSLIFAMLSELSIVFIMEARSIQKHLLFYV